MQRRRRPRQENTLGGSGSGSGSVWSRRHQLFSKSARCLCPGYHLWLVPSYQEKYFRWLEIVPPLLLALGLLHILWLKPSLASQAFQRICSIFTPAPPYVANATKMEKGYEAIYTLEISTTGPSRAYIRYLLGRYTRSEEIQVNGRPVWLSSGWTFSTIFYYSRFNKWTVKGLFGPWFLHDWQGFIETASQKDAGEMKSRKTKPDEVDEYGWLYWNGQYWKFDPDLRVTGGNKNSLEFFLMLINFQPRKSLNNSSC